jgi:SAM-dependent methyltransferase
MLRDLGFNNACGLDPSDDAIRFCGTKGFLQVQKGDVCQIPYPDASFELILATDVIEHVDDDRLALREIVRVLAPAGRVLLTVPAFRSLWGRQDEVAMHKRRYNLHQLANLVRENGLTIEKSYYFNFLLFIPIWLARRLIDLFNLPVENENRVNNAVLNRILLAIFRADARSARIIHPPFGVSALTIAVKE